MPNSQGRLDYVFVDFEPCWQTIPNDNVAEAVRQVRAHTDPRINQAKVGSYNYFPCSTMPWKPYPDQNDEERQQMVNGSYYSTGVNVAMPSLYPYESYSEHAETYTWGYASCPE